MKCKDCKYFCRLADKNNTQWLLKDVCALHADEKIIYFTQALDDACEEGNLNNEKNHTGRT